MADIRAISVVVPTYRRPDLLRACLAALLSQHVDLDRFEVIVVNDASGDSTAQVLDAAVAQWPHLQVITQPVNRGPAAARNAGIAAASSDLVLFIDDDIVAPPDLVAQHIAFHADAADPLLGVVGHVTWLPDMEISPFMRWLDTTELQFRFTAMSEGLVEKPWQAFYTCNLSLHTRLLRDSGGFDERFPYPAFEDIDLGIRLAARGFRLQYRPSALAWHSRHFTLEEFCRRTRQVGESATLLSEAQPDLPFELPLNDAEPQGLRGLAIRSLPSAARVLPTSRVRAMAYRAAVNRAYREGVRAGRTRTDARS